MKDEQTELQRAFAVVRTAEERVTATINAWCEEPGGPAHPWEVQIASASVLDLQASVDDQAITLMVDWGDNSGESPEDTEERLRPLLRELGIERVWAKRLIDMPVDVPPAEGWPTAPLWGADGVSRYNGPIEAGMTFECIGSPLVSIAPGDTRTIAGAPPKLLDVLFSNGKNLTEEDFRASMRPLSPCAHCGHAAEAHRNGFGRLADCGVDKEAGFCGCTQYETRKP